MNVRMFKHKSVKLFVYLLIFLVVGPLLGLVVGSLFSGGDLTLIMPSGRRLDLLTQTLLFGGGVSITASVIALPAALFLWRKQSWGHYRWLVFSGFLIPPYIQVAAWQILINWVKVLGGQSPLAVTGWGISWWVQTIYLLPLATGLLLVLLELIDSEEIKAAQLLASSKIVWRNVILPKLIPGIAAIAMILFVFSMIDYTIPSLFAVNTYALEIMAEFSASHSAVSAMLIAWPLVGIVVLLLLLMSRIIPRSLKNVSYRPAHNLQLDFSRGSRWIQFATFAILLMLMLLPILSVFSKADVFKMLPIVLGENGKQIFETFIMALVATGLMVINGVILALFLQEPLRRKWWLLVLLPLVIPPSLIGISLINLAQKWLPLAVSTSYVLPIWALVIRFSPILIALISAGLQYIPRHEVESGLLLNTSQATIRHILIPRLAPVISISAVLSFVLCLGDLGATLLVVPPGVTTITITIYNYLHYGASAKVAALCLLIMIIVMAVVLGAILQLQRRKIQQ